MICAYNTEEILYTKEVTKLAEKLTDENEKQEHTERLQRGNEGLEKQRNKLNEYHNKLENLCNPKITEASKPNRSNSYPPGPRRLGNRRRLERRNKPRRNASNGTRNQSLRDPGHQQDHNRDEAIHGWDHNTEPHTNVTSNPNGHRHPQRYANCCTISPSFFRAWPKT